MSNGRSKIIEERGAIKDLDLLCASMNETTLTRYVACMHDDIAALRAENERLRCEYRLALSARDYANDMLTKSRAENERLKEAVEAMRAKCEAIARQVEKKRGELLVKNINPFDNGGMASAGYIADTIAALESGEIRAALPTETETPLEKHGISEE